MQATESSGLPEVQTKQQDLGVRVRALLADKGFKSVAADGFGAPGVVVSYTGDPDIKSGKKCAARSLQIAAGVPLKCDEPEDFQTFRVGLFGLDKLGDVDGTVASFESVLNEILG